MAPKVSHRRKNEKEIGYAGIPFKHSVFCFAAEYLFFLAAARPDYESTLTDQSGVRTR